MIRRLLEANYFENRKQPTPQRITFWLRELRTAQLLIETATSFCSRATELQAERPLLKCAIAEAEEDLDSALFFEQRQEQAVDREYWLPLRAELEALRRERASKTRDRLRKPQLGRVRSRREAAS